MVALCCQSKKFKKKKKKKGKKIKIIKKIKNKKFFTQKKKTKLRWPMSAKSDT